MARVALLPLTSLLLASHSPHYTVLKEPYNYHPQLFIMRQRDGRSKGSAFIRYFDRHACYTPGKQCCTPSHKRLQPLALRVASART